MNKASWFKPIKCTSMLLPSNMRVFHSLLLLTAGFPGRFLALSPKGVT